MTLDDKIATTNKNTELLCSRSHKMVVKSDKILIYTILRKWERVV